jgi:hypothetical protein
MERSWKEGSMLDLEKLDTIDWSTLESAYGTADALPAALCNLDTPDEEVRAAAWSTVWSELEHQGTVFQASAYAAPFLVAWLSEAQGEEKCDLVTLLARLARGNSYKRQHLNLTDERHKQDPIFQQEMAQEIRWVELTHQAVREGMDLYLTFLDDQDLQLRMATTYLLASFKEDQAWLKPHLQEYLERETEERMLACLLLSLGQLLPANGDSSDLLMPYLIAGDTPLVRFCAAMALCFLLKEATPEEAMLVFFTALIDPASAQTTYNDLPLTWADSTVPFQALDFLRWLASSRHRDLIIGRMVDLLPTLNEILVGEVADHLLHVAFQWEEFELPPQVLRENLNAEQRAVLNAIATREHLWRVEQESPDHLILNGIRQDLLFLGLPTTQHDLQTFLALETP